MKTELTFNVLYSGTRSGGENQSLVDIAIAQMEANRQWLTDLDVLVLCHHANTSHAERNCAKIRRALDLLDTLPLTLGHSGSQAFSHALSLLEWLMSGGEYRRAVCILADEEFGQNGLPLPVQENPLSIIEIMPL
ncbi:hypothetical protein [Paenibacillus durus]|uniref:Beta-ketoacyl synthase N-terminal domain-containing protein n=1 Tax=Paenibacillus durus TaxID=44251 RepID=A0A089HRF8_PAEDU|nr:hypothetical protein [Paenibacillus durus]AIQ12908.1 hypothetical protein PDUR_14030 [Paenibacillus durus]